jgi:Co/Zn/Cd efflux system component
MGRRNRRWPFGYRLILWYVGAVAAILLIVAVLFILKTAHG